MNVGEWVGAITVADRLDEDITAREDDEPVR